MRLRKSVAMLDRKTGPEHFWLEITFKLGSQVNKIKKVSLLELSTSPSLLFHIFCRRMSCECPACGRGRIAFQPALCIERC